MPAFTEGSFTRFKKTFLNQKEFYKKRRIYYNISTVTGNIKRGHMKKVTLQDLAKELGISKGTINRVIRERPDVNYETRQKVLAVIEKYNYKPDKIARTLSLKEKKYKIGVIYQKNPEFFWSNVEKGIKAADEELTDFGTEIIYKALDSSRDIDELILKMEELLAEKVDAIALVPVDNIKLKEKIKVVIEKGIPVATFNDDIEDSGRLFYIGPQMRQSGRIAGELMGKFLRGRGKILTINSDINSMAYKERLEGFNEVIADRYKDVNIITNYTCSYEKMGNEAYDIIELMVNGMNDIAGIYNIDGSSLYNIGEILKKNSKLKDTILIGHERWQKVDELISEGVIDVSICQDAFMQGYKAVKILFEYLFEGKKPVIDKYFVHSDIVMRENVDMVNVK